MAAWTFSGALVPKDSLVKHGITPGDSVWEYGTGIDIHGRVERKFWLEAAPIALAKNLTGDFKAVDHWSILAKAFSNGSVLLTAWPDSLEFAIDLRAAYAPDVIALCNFAIVSNCCFLLGVEATVYEADPEMVTQFLIASNAMIWAQKFGKSMKDFDLAGAK